MENRNQEKNIVGRAYLYIVVFRVFSILQYKDSLIDLYNAVDGDANCDEDMNMADAVLIMQSLANPDKYQISEQGEFNSDLNGDGITNADALAVQKMLLNLD